MKFRDYLKVVGKSPEKFAPECGLSVKTIRNMANGKDVYLSTALYIERWTRGVVTCKDLEPEPSHKPRRSSPSKEEGDNQSSS